VQVEYCAGHPNFRGLLKTATMTMALCRLHNFCINCRLLLTKKAGERWWAAPWSSRKTKIAPPLAVDEAEILPVETTCRPTYLRGDSSWQRHTEALENKEKRCRSRAENGEVENTPDVCVAAVESQRAVAAYTKQWSGIK
jgi:hypothetical protein